MKLIDFFRKLGIFVDNPYSRRFRQNVLGTKIFISLYVDGIAYSSSADAVEFYTDENGRLVSANFISNEKSPIELTDEEMQKELDSAMVLIGGY